MSTSDPQRDPYVPFSEFDQWVESDATRLVDRFNTQLSTLRAEVGEVVATNALRKATRWAAIDTGALEGLYDVDRGFTYSVAVSTATWERIAEVKGESTARSIDDALGAYDFVLDAVTKRHPITEVWVRELHTLVTASQETYTVLTAIGTQEQDLPRGVYKSQPNNPLNLRSATIHEYASPADTPAEMARLVTELTSERFLNGHPVLQAALAHHAFVCIHPFADGNGRVARALASLFLYRGYSLPALVFADQKSEYLDALEAADHGNIEKFIEFMANRVVDAINMISDEIRVALEDDIDEQMAALRPSLEGIAGIPHVEMDTIAERLIQRLRSDLDEEIATKPLQSPLSAHTDRWSKIYLEEIEGYRYPPGHEEMLLQIQGTPPAKINKSASISILVRRPEHDGADLVLMRDNQDTILEIFAREVHPTFSQSLLYRLRSLAIREYRRLTAVARKAAEEALRERGYI